MGQTYPLPDVGDEWAEQHLAAQDERVGPYPEQLESTLASSTADSRRAETGAGQHGSGERHDARQSTDARTATDASDERSPERTAAQPAKHEVQVDYEPPPARPPRPRRQPGPPRRRTPVRRHADRRRPRGRPPPDTLRELAFLDRINEIGPADQLDGASQLPRLYDEDYAILALLDRVGLAPASLIGRAALPGRATRSVNDRLIKLYRHGLIARHNTGLRERTRSDGKPPLLYSLTRRGLASRAGTHASAGDLPQARLAARSSNRAPAGSPTTCTRSAGRSSSTAPSASSATDRWRTPRYATGRYPVPQVGSGQRRHPITRQRDPSTRRAGDHRPRAEDVHRDQARPLARAAHPSSSKLTCDLLVELDLTARPSYNRDKFLAYDAFLCGWASPTHATAPRAPAPQSSS